MFEDSHTPHWHNRPSCWLVWWRNDQAQTSAVFAVVCWVVNPSYQPIAFYAPDVIKYLRKNRSVTNQITASLIEFRCSCCLITSSRDFLVMYHIMNNWHYLLKEYIIFLECYFSQLRYEEEEWVKKNYKTEKVFWVPGSALITWSRVWLSSWWSSEWLHFLTELR